MCPCGYIHNQSSIPDEGYVTVRDEDYERLIEAERTSYEIAGHRLPSDDHPRLKDWDEALSVTVSLTRRLYQCPKCGRLLWERSDTGLYDSYVPEDR